MTDITIPPAALEAGARAIEKSLRTARITLETEDGYKPEARAAFLAMMKAWPDMAYRVMPYAALILPLTTQENGDD